MVAFALATLALPTTAAAYPGQLDPTFSGNGIVKGPPFSYPSPPGVFTTRDVIVQPDGRIVAGGTWLVQGEQGFGVTRYLSNGELDSSFGDDGYQLIRFRHRAQGFDVGLQQDGRIVVAGTVDVGRRSAGSSFRRGKMAVARLTPEGLLDTSFGDDGIRVIRRFGYSRFTPRTAIFETAMALEPDGGIVLGGITWHPFRNLDFAVAKLTPRGQLDPSFSNDGLKAFGFPHRTDRLSDVTIDRTGRIVVCGATDYRVNRIRSVFGVARLTPSGRMDRSFSGDGRNVIDGTKQPEAVAARPGGAVVVAGEAERFRSRIALAQLGEDGSHDRSFGDRGVRYTRLRDSAEVSRVALQRDGRIVLVGDAGFIPEDGVYPEKNDLALLRYRRDGNLDRSFSRNGKTVTDFGREDYAYGLALQPDGRIVVSAVTEGRPAGHYDLARYKNDGLPPGG